MPNGNSQDLYLSVGVTGHRDLVAAEIPGIRRALEAFFRGLQREFPDLPIQLITPLAEGGDQLAAQALSELACPSTSATSAR